VTAIVCQMCGEITIRRGAMQKYCAICSEKRDLERKGRWAKDHPKHVDHAVLEARWKETHALRKQAGLVNSEARGATWMVDGPPELLWIVRVAFPFDYAISKNHIWSTRSDGHVFLREGHRKIRNDLVMIMKSALVHQRVAQNKLWLDILVQKSDHKGDAINVVDGICDALKVATGLDDRWYSIRGLDWEVVKDNPMVYVGIGQTSLEDMIVCAYCGRMLSLDNFGSNASNKMTGRSRTCRECTAVTNKMRKSRRKSVGIGGGHAE
jgi:hypothetical protein